MTSVNVTTTKNTVTVNGETRVVTVKTQGPQGPSLPDGDKGDVTVSSNGTAISINNSAVTSAKIADGAIVDADINASAAIALTKLATGALPTAITVTSANISDLSIVDADISASAAISLSKLATGALPTAITVTSANISDLSIVNADINASAAIAGTKISPDFGSQNIVTTGTAATGALGVTGNLTVSGTVDGVDVATRDALFGGLTSSSGVLSNGVTATTQSASDNSTKIATTAYTDTAISNLINGAPAALDTLNELAAALNDDAAFSTTVTNSIATKMPLAGGQFTGNVTFSGTQTVDGRDLSVDGAKLDGIESGATADQTAAEIRTLVESASDSNVFTDADHSKLNGIEASATADQTKSDIDALGIAASTATTLATARTIAGTSFDGSANIDISYTNLTNKLSVGDGGLTQNNFTDALKTKLDGVETGATADQTASEIKTAYESNSDTNAFTDADHTKLDGIEASATADQTAAEIKTLLDSNGIVNSNVDASAAIAGTKISPNFGSQNIVTTGTIGSGDLTITSAAPFINFIDSDHNSDFNIQINAGSLNFNDTTNSTTRIAIASDGTVDVNGNLDIGAGCDVTGNITVTGTVDGVDIAARNTLFGGLTSSSGVLSNGVTATTQSASDNSTKVATTAYADTAVANLVDSAPGTLNTLNELAAALGDDPNFATTVTNSIATKLPLAGGQITGNITCSGSQTFDGRDLSVDGTKLDGIESNATADQTASEIVALVADQTIAPSEIDMEDNEKIQLGTGDDLEIYHDGSNSYIKDTGTGQLRLATNEFLITNAAVSENMFKIFENGAVELYYDASKKLETTNTGVEVDGNVQFPDGGEVKLGADGDLRMFHSGSQNYVQSYNDKTFRIQSFGTSAEIKLQTNESENNIICKPNGATELYYDNSKKLHTVADGIYVTGNIYSNKTGTAAAISLTDNGRLAFGSGADLQIYHDGNNSKISHVGTGGLYIGADTFGLQKGDHSENYISMAANGAVELYYDNSKKLETTAIGVTISGDLKLPDNENVRLGDSNDLILYHNGTNSLIENATGELRIKSSDQVLLQKYGTGESMVRAVPDNTVELRYDNSKKFETTSGGATLTGALTTTGNINVPTANSVVTGSVVTTNATALTAVDNGTAYFGTGLDLRISHTGTNSYITNTTGTLFTLSNIFEVKGSDGNETHLKTTNDGAVELYYDNSVKLATTGAGVDINGNLNFDDNEYALFGNSNDLQIYHDGSNSRIHDAGTGILAISGNQIDFQSANQGESLLQAVENGAVKLRYDNSLKFETTSAGATVTGALATTSLSATGGITGTGGNFILGDSSGTSNNRIKLGASGDLQIYHASNIDKIESNGAGMHIRQINNGDVHIHAGADSSAANNRIVARSAGAAELYHSGTKKFETLTNGIKVDGNIFMDDNNEIRLGDSGDFQLFHNSSTGEARIFNSNAAGINIITDLFNVKNNANNETLLKATNGGAVELYHDNSKKLETVSNGVTVTGRILPTGNNNVGVVHNDNIKSVFGNSDDLQIYHNGTENIITTNNSAILQIRCNGTEKAIEVNPDGNVELYYDNSKKFETTTDGVQVTGKFKSNAAYNVVGAEIIGGASGYSEPLIVKTANGDVKFTVDGDGNVLVGTTSTTVESLTSAGQGVKLAQSGRMLEVASNAQPAVGFNRTGDDGTIVRLIGQGSLEGTITVSGSTVSYNGGHLSRWSQIKGLSQTDKSDRPTIYQGTVMSNLDDLCVWEGEDNQQLNMTKISDVVGDKDVAGVFFTWDDDDDKVVNDFYVAMTGDLVIRVAASTTVARGDLLISAGDGTAKPQADDIVRSSTIAKIISTNHTATYPDGSKAYPCVLMAC